MKFLKIIPRAANRPSQIFLYVTQKCNSKCITCNFWKDKNAKDLPKEVIFKFVDEIHAWLGPKNFILTGGGEPLMNKDIFDIIKHIHSKESFVKIVTNGFFLDKKTIDRLVESGMSEILISLNGMTPKTHDFSRGVEGGLNKIFEAVEYIREKYHQLSISFLMTIFKQNLDEIIPAIEYANKAKASITLQPIFPTFDANYSLKGKVKEELWPDDIKKIKNIFKEINNYKSKGYPVIIEDGFLESCIDYFKNPSLPYANNGKIRFHNLSLHGNGDVKLCECYPSLGNIKNTPIKELWKSKLAKEQRKQMRSCPSYCLTVLNNRMPTFKDFIKQI